MARSGQGRHGTPPTIVAFVLPCCSAQSAAFADIAAVRGVFPSHLIRMGRNQTPGFASGGPAPINGNARCGRCSPYAPKFGSLATWANQQGDIMSRQIAKPHRIALALQGGGSFGAFTWGVADRLLADEAIEIAGISGASAGAVNASLIASGLALGGRDEARATLARFWQRLAELPSVPHIE
eukprot:gene22551-23742_t